MIDDTTIECSDSTLKALTRLGMELINGKCAELERELSVAVARNVALLDELDKSRSTCEELRAQMCLLISRFQPVSTVPAHPAASPQSSRMSQEFLEALESFADRRQMDHTDKSVTQGHEDLQTVVSPPLSAAAAVSCRVVSAPQQHVVPLSSVAAVSSKSLTGSTENLSEKFLCVGEAPLPGVCQTHASVAAPRREALPVVTAGPAARHKGRPPSTAIDLANTTTNHHPAVEKATPSGVAPLSSAVRAHLTGFVGAQKTQLQASLKQLGVRVVDDVRDIELLGSTLSAKGVTHLISPISCRNMKKVAAIATARWAVRPINTHQHRTRRMHTV
jgi:hypothetical protein